MLKPAEIDVDHFVPESRSSASSAVAGDPGMLTTIRPASSPNLLDAGNAASDHDIPFAALMPVRSLIPAPFVIAA